MFSWTQSGWQGTEAGPEPGLGWSSASQTPFTGKRRIELRSRPRWPSGITTSPPLEWKSALFCFSIWYHVLEALLSSQSCPPRRVSSQLSRAHSGSSLPSCAHTGGDQRYVLLSPSLFGPKSQSWFSGAPSAGFRVGIGDKWKRSTCVQRSRRRWLIRLHKISPLRCPLASCLCLWLCVLVAKVPNA